MLNILDASQLGPQNYVPPAPDLGVTPPALAKSAGPSKWDNVKVVSPDSPLFWAGAFIAVTLGLIGFTSTARVGPIRGGVQVGKS